MQSTDMHTLKRREVNKFMFWLHYKTNKNLFCGCLISIIPTLSRFLFVQAIMSSANFACSYMRNKFITAENKNPRFTYNYIIIAFVLNSAIDNLTI